MENIAHTLAGFALARTGLARRRCDTLVLVLGSNLPDADLLWSMRSRSAYLDEHRGITHSIAGGTLLGLAFAGAVWGITGPGRRALARLQRRDPGMATMARVPGSSPNDLVRPPAEADPPFLRLAVLAVVAVLLHFGFDGLNDYGVRPFLPFGDRWVYTDLAFIVDPWFWLLLGGGLHLAMPRRAEVGSPQEGRRIALREAVAWAGWAILSLPVLLAAPVPAVSRCLWLAGLAAIALLRFRPPRFGSRALRHRTIPGFGRRALRPFEASPIDLRLASGALRNPLPPRVSLALLAAYVAGLAALHAVALERARTAFASFPEARGTEIAVLPTPANPLGWRAYRVAEDGILAGTIRLLDDHPRLLDTIHAPRQLDLPEVLAALATPEGRTAARFSRFLFAEVAREGGEPAVRLRDARYAWRGGRDSWATVVVALPRP